MSGIEYGGTGTLADVEALLNRRFDPATAEDWDRVGLVSGDLEQPIRSVLFAVDPFEDVVAEAAERDFDLLVTHHPLLLRGIHEASSATAKGRLLRQLIKSDVALICAHTNADSAVAGVNDALAAVVGLGATRPIRAIPDHEMSKIVVHTPADSVDELVAAMSVAGAGQLGNYDSCAYVSNGQGQFRPLSGATPHIGEIGLLERVDEHRIEMVVESRNANAALEAVKRHHPYETPAVDVVKLTDPPGARGMGRWGDLAVPTTLRGLAERLARELPHTNHGVRIAGDPDAPIQTAAVCGGSGDSLLGSVRDLPVDAYVTSDLRHHPATDHLAENGCALLDIAHSAGEWLWLQGAADQLTADAADAGFEIMTEVSTINTDPWSAHIASVT